PLHLARVRMPKRLRKRGAGPGGGLSPPRPTRTVEPRAGYDGRAAAGTCRPAGAIAHQPPPAAGGRLRAAGERRRVPHGGGAQDRAFRMAGTEAGGASSSVSGRKSAPWISAISSGAAACSPLARRSGPLSTVVLEMIHDGVGN